MAGVAQVAVELALDRTFDYDIPDPLKGEVQVGSQVEVPFGRRHVRGYVVGLAAASEVQQRRTIARVIGDTPLISPSMLNLAQWIAGYYLSPVEHAIRTVLPSAVRRSGARFKERAYVVMEEKGRDEAAIRSLRARHPRRADVLDAVRREGELFLHELIGLARTTRQTVEHLQADGYVRIGTRAELRDPLLGRDLLPTAPLQLMPQQVDALNLICRAMDTFEPRVVLVYGVTGSGKTEVYLQAIQHGLDRGRGAIVLVPEISLTPQTVDRFHSRFGDRIAVLHSALATGERHDEWHRIQRGQAQIVIGARSALFAPVRDLGVIVVDEEHEQTYKQEESPRYHARDVAVVRGHFERVAVVLGTATPSLESMNNVDRGKYALARMPHRVDHKKMPSIRVVDMRLEAQREGRVNVLSRDLMTAIRDRLDRREQVILFLNRRGYATSLICPQCGYVAGCDQCSIALTYHRATHELLCHLCGQRAPVPQACPNPECRDPAFRYAGMGTQRVEDVMAKVFPRARVERMDADSTRRRGSHARILNQFRSHEIDVLIGTQMIAKGLHFPNVTLVGVVFADASLHVPDFRAGERTFQLLTQVAGRAGRGDVMGEVIVQTFTPFHPAVQAARALDYDLWYDQEIEFRRELLYPPFSHLACLTISGGSEALVRFAAESFVKKLAPEIPADAICSEATPAPLARVRGRCRYQILLRASAARSILAPLKRTAEAFPWPKEIKHVIDIDAYSMM
jgi:primosomal protein N' (replication factor Y)